MAIQSFEYFVRNNCAKADWNIAKLNDRQAMLKFTMESGRVQTVYITKFDSCLEFSVLDRGDSEAIALAQELKAD
ncbi:hypothetical protein [Dapis sp. BLCC M229]|uniref:hypothetical protein n=1 Tax=Dapis sp. BLCC M229 TaxID=3400188 RepID=UPI003CE9026B